LGARRPAKGDGEENKSDDAADLELRGATRENFDG
jgi:hypothetical protein